MVAAKSSRVNRQYKKKYRIRNWREYERGLRSRGDVTIWLSEDAIAAWVPPKNGLRGGQRRYSNLAVRTALTLRVVLPDGFRGVLRHVFAGAAPEPDVEIKKQKRGQIVIEIKGVDVYDPTTGQIRSASTDDIACWFIDSNYNGESFFVRHAYFTGAKEPYANLKRALRAEIDEAAWSSLYRTVSRPFDKPETGKFAVKVINHYGDEVLKVFEI